ncbi:MAG: hypothetical protein AB7W59_09955 [Acidimicrobiia bacterium]
MNEKLAWDIARAGGIVAWGLLSFSVIWGMLLASRLLGQRAPAPWLLELHRYLGALSLVFTGVHIGGLVGDNWLHIGWAEVLVPQASAWKPLAVTWGVLALYLLLAVEVTSLGKKLLPQKLWRRIHLLAFPLVLVTSLHGAQAGTDATNRLYRALSVGVLAAILVLTMVRLAIGRRARKRRQGAAGATGGAAGAGAGATPMAPAGRAGRPARPDAGQAGSPAAGGQRAASTAGPAAASGGAPPSARMRSR